MYVSRYTEVARAIEERINKGEFEHKLPTMRSLKEEYRTSFNLLCRIINRLKARDIVYTVPGRGTFLTKKR